MDIQIRPADSSEHDARAFVHFAGMTSDYAQYLLGRHWERIMVNLAQHPNHELSAQTAHFIEVDGQVAGMLSAYSDAQRGQYGGRARRLMLRYAFTRLPQMGYAFIKLSPVWRHSLQTPPGMYYIQFLALDPQYRGLGLSRHLLTKAEADARAAGCTLLGLDVNVENSKAISIYRLYGFTIEHTTPRLRFEGQQIGEHRMVKTLD